MGTTNGYDKYRQTGRTTTMLSQAAMLACQGKKVLVLFPTIQRSYAASSDFTRTYIHQFDGTRTKSRCRWGTGWVEFGSDQLYENTLRGKARVDLPDFIMADHTVYEEAIKNLCTPWIQMARLNPKLAEVIKELTEKSKHCSCVPYL
jgi:hypothetical protein